MDQNRKEMSDDLFNICLDKYSGKTKITWDELAKEHRKSNGDNLRKEFARERKRRGVLSKGSQTDSKIKNVESDKPEDYITEWERGEAPESGESTIKMVIDYEKKGYLEKIFHARNKTPEDMLLFHGFDPVKWDQESMHVQNNGWLMPAGGGDYYYCYQSKISVQPQKNKITPEYIDRKFKELLDELNDSLPSFPPAPMESYDEDGVVIEIDLADFHIGKISYDGVRDFNGDIIDALHDMYHQIKHKKISKIVLVNLGDISHYDSGGKKATTKGTPVESTDDTPQELFDVILNLLIYIVMLFMRLAPVEVISVFGNHDENFTYYVFKALEIYFRNEKNATFDISHKAHKARLYGITLVGYSHGSVNKGRLETNMLQVLFRELWGMAKQAEIHVGHFHSEKHEEKGGLTLRYLPSPSTTDKWHYDNLFVGAKRAITAFEFHMTKGFRSYMMSVIE